MTRTDIITVLTTLQTHGMYYGDSVERVERNELGLPTELETGIEPVTSSLPRTCSTN